MTATLAALVLALLCWMTLCGWCGFRGRLGAFVLVMALGMALNMAWIVLALKARPTEADALAAQAALALYGLCALVIGWLVGRLVRQWRASRVDRGEV